MNVIIANDLTKKYGNTVAVKGINLEIPEKSIYALIGKTGSGKSTLIHILCGLTSSNYGSCSVLGISPTDGSERIRKQCGVITDNAKLYENISVMENLAFFGKLSGMSGTEARDRASFLLHSFGVWEDRDIPVSKMTTNRKKLVSICRAFIDSPKVLLLDDCFEGFDAELVNLCSAKIKELASDEGITVFITASTTGGLDICDSYAIMRNGEIAAKGNLESLIKQSGLKRKASLRTLDNKLSLALDGFSKTDDGFFEKHINSEQDMVDIVSRAVFLGNKLVEAKLSAPSLDELFDYYTGTEDEDD